MRGATCFCLAALMMAGCAVNRYVVAPYDKVTLAAAEDVNPDLEGRASPIAVKIYELSSRATFDNLDFEAAFSNASVLLSEELRSMGEYVIQPGDSILHRIDMDEETEYVAVVAGFRDIDRARWKLVYPINSDWYYSHVVRLDADQVILGAKEVKDEADQ